MVHSSRYTVTTRVKPSDFERLSRYTAVTWGLQALQEFLIFDF
jgi:hypothetical protein